MRSAKTLKKQPEKWLGTWPLFYTMLSYSPSSRAVISVWKSCPASWCWCKKRSDVSSARELHDEIAQTLTALSISLQLAAHTSGAPHAERLAEAQRLGEDLSQRIRQLSLDLRPPMLDDLGLLPTLLWYFDRCNQQLRVQVEFEHQGLEQPLDAEIEIVVYRIVQEALTNIARHAGVRAASVRLWANPTTLSVQVEDRGSGFDVWQTLGRPTSGGLTGMRERVRLVGGQLVIDTQPGAGTCLTALLPLGPARKTKGDQQ